MTKEVLINFNVLTITNSYNVLIHKNPTEHVYPILGQSK